MDVFTRLLVAPHLDALFDAWLITITTSEAVQFSAKVTAEQRTALGLAGDLRVSNLRAEHHLYLDFHRQNVWGN